MTPAEAQELLNRADRLEEQRQHTANILAASIRERVRQARRSDPALQQVKMPAGYGI